MIQETEIMIKYTGDGVTTSFPFTYPYLDKSYVYGYLIDKEGVITAITSNYSYDDVEHKYTYPVEGTPISSATKLLLIRETPISQTTDLPDKTPFTQIETSLDKLTEILQEHHEELVRCLKVSWSSDKTAEEVLDDLKNATKESQEISVNAALLAKRWAVSTKSPDDAEDPDSATGLTQSSRTWALEARCLAREIYNIGAQTGRILEPFSVTYDASGNYATITENGVTYTITRDNLDRLNTISDGSVTLQAQYNGSGIFTGMVLIEGV